jgi:anti-sigma factor RsiW
VILEILADYVDATLDLKSARSLEEHLRACGACMAYLLRRFMLERIMRKAP